ncbi:MAG: ankyrin repeat domain-containing protein [Bacteroidetes bacterium]|nr:ankyrin repeat domain-containing protein [Bacteroidota bacterium]
MKITCSRCGYEFSKKSYAADYCPKCGSNFIEKSENQQDKEIINNTIENNNDEQKTELEWIKFRCKYCRNTYYEICCKGSAYYCSPDDPRVQLLAAIGYFDIVRKKPDMEKVRELLNANEMNPKINLDFKTGSKPRSLLSLAIESGSLELVRELYNAGIDISTNAVAYAAHCNKYDILEFLVNKGANLEGFFYNQETALYYAAHRGSVESVNLLLAHNANISPARYGYGDPLMAAVENGHEEIVKILLAHGANPNIKNDMSGSTLSIAKKKGFSSIIKMLIENGATLE